MKKRHFFIRNLEAWGYLEIFLVAAVTAVLGIRLFLNLTGYPQLGGRGLHIAHMLWGGLLMLAAIIILLSFLSKAADRVAAILGGVGFGTFIDEVGKFVTSDNNYFFEPAAALIYVTFILIFLAIHTLHTRQAYSRQEYLLNALRELEQIALHDLDEEEKRRAFHFLERSDPRHPLVVPLKHLLDRADSIPPPKPGLLTHTKNCLRDWYRKIAQLPGFSLALTAFFVVQLVIKFIETFVLVFFVGLGWEQILDLRIFGRVAARMHALSFIDWAQLSSSLLSGAFIFLGIMHIRRSRLAAFQMFERSILVSIFLTQVFHFYKEQFAALLGLFLNILILIALRYMIDRERVADVEVRDRSSSQGPLWPGRRPPSQQHSLQANFRTLPHRG